jgi:gamma-glutamylcyclotransferase (GGCT)/AIG2-like uncharacterized protein YtfP
MLSVPTGIFVYGTLRSDCLELTEYNKKFNNGCITIPAMIHGAQLYYDGYYPYMIITNNKDNIVYGKFVIPIITTIENKIKECDIIENEGTMYSRIIVDILTESSHIDNIFNKEQAFTYIRTYINKFDIKIEGGDWLYVNKKELLLQYLHNKYSNIEKHILIEIIDRSNSDCRLIDSLIKWMYS